MPTKLDIYIFTIIAGLIFLLVDYLLVPGCMVHPEVSLAALAWLIRNIYR
jgi:NADH:ubiquinone oxidoreductase subunit B-like Fe-S oxidoreductase